MLVHAVYCRCGNIGGNSAVQLYSCFLPSNRPDSCGRSLTSRDSVGTDCCGTSDVLQFAQTVASRWLLDLQAGHWRPTIKKANSIPNGPNNSPRRKPSPPFPFLVATSAAAIAHSIQKKNHSIFLRLNVSMRAIDCLRVWSNLHARDLSNAARS